MASLNKRSSVGDSAEVDNNLEEELKQEMMKYNQRIGLLVHGYIRIGAQSNHQNIRWNDLTELVHVYYKEDFQIYKQINKQCMDDHGIFEQEYQIPTDQELIEMYEEMFEDCF